LIYGRQSAEAGRSAAPVAAGIAPDHAERFGHKPSINHVLPVGQLA
jgi:hypothetical protein